MIENMIGELLEGKKQARQIYLDSGKVPEDVFNKFERSDMTKNKKYLEWMCREYASYPERAQHIIDTAMAFERLVRRKKIQGQDADIYRHNMEEADNIVSEKSGVQSKSEEKKEIKDKQVEKVFENDEVLIISPLTREASILYGSGTKWCTAMNKTDCHWNSYWRNGTKLYYIIRKNVPEKQRKKFAVAVSPGSGHKSCYDEEDSSIDYKKMMKEIGLTEMA